MNNLVSSISATTMHSLGWTLLHFLWQGTALAAVAAVLMGLCRRASTRYVVAVAALSIMLITPIATFFSLAPFSSTAAVNSSSLRSSAPVINGQKAESPLAAIHLSQPATDSLPWLVDAWLLGVVFLSLRTAGGFFFLEWQRRKRSTEVNSQLAAMCRSLQHRLGVTRAIRYCECAWIQAPAVVGWFRPIVLLPVTALTGLSEEQLESIIAHELAHIRRFDAFVNVFQIAVETLLFYHPAVWWLSKRIRDEREHCCDDVAVSLCGNPTEYARALTLMEEWRSAPALAMAANRGPLSQRILRLLGLKPAGHRHLGIAGGILCLTAALASGNALLGIAHPKLHAAAATTQAAFVHFNWAQSAPQTAPQTSSQAAPAAASAPKPSAGHSQSSAQSPSGSSYVDGMQAAGLGDLTAEQLIAMKIQDVTPDYVRGMHDLGLRPSVDELIAMKIQSVTPEYVRDVRSLGLTPDVDQLVAMRIQDVTSDYIRGMKDAGLQPAVDLLIAMKIQGVSPEYVRDMHSQNLQPSGDQLVAMRIQGVTPEYVRDIQALGVKPTLDQLVAMRIQDVTPEYIKDLQGAGFKLTVEEVIAAKIQDIDKDFIDRAAKHGFKNLTLEKLIQLKEAGILESGTDI